MCDFRKYKKLKKKGTPPEEAYSVAKGEGLNPLGCMKILCKVYSLSLAEAKEVMVKCDYNCDSLDRFQKEQILPILRDVFEGGDHDVDSKK